MTGSSAKEMSLAGMWADVFLAAEPDAAIHEVTAGRGADVAIDPVGGDLRRTQAYELLASSGRLVLLGNASGQDTAFSGDSAWLGTRHVIGLRLAGVAHNIPRQASAALSAVVDLAHRDVLREPAVAILPIDAARRGFIRPSRPGRPRQDGSGYAVQELVRFGGKELTLHPMQIVSVVIEWPGCRDE